VHFQWANPDAVGWKPPAVDNLRFILNSHARHLRLADRLGVRLLLGTDAGSMGIIHGNAVFDEINRYLEAGLSLQSTLKAATSAARRHFCSPHPLLSKGAPLDAILLESSPFNDINALRSPLRVWAAAGDHDHG
jgi:imidazolonepropionase-like amidohydrolase